MELKHLISHEALRSTILSGAAGTDIPSLRTFIEILLGNSLEYDSNNIDCYTLPCMCYHIDSEVLAEVVLGLTRQDQSPCSRVATSRRRRIAYGPSRWT